MALAYADHSVARTHASADQNVARTRCESTQLQGCIVYTCVMFVNTCSRKTLYMMAMLLACYYSHAWPKQPRREYAQFAHSLADLKLHMHCLRLYKTSFQNRILMPKRKNCICQALLFASSQNLKKNHTSHFRLRTSHFSFLTASFTLQTSHFTLHTSHYALRTPNLTSHSTLLTSHFPLLPSHCTLHTALSTPHTSHCSKPTCYKKTLAQKWRISANKSMSQPSCSQSKTIYEIQLQETLRMQPKQEATLTQPFQCDLRRLSCKTQEKYAQWRRKL